MIKSSTFFQRRELIHQFVINDLSDRYAGQAIGIVWAFMHPLFLMGVYTFLFAYVFPARFGDGYGVSDFSTNILAGILSWLIFQDLLSRSTTTMISHINLVKQIVFPIEILPIKTAFASIIPYTVSLIFVFGFSFFKGYLSWFSIMIVWVLFFQAFAMLGLAFILSSVGVFFRDVKDIVQFFCAINLFAQPILYNPASTPDWLSFLFYFNPFSYFVWCWQDCLYHGNFEHPIAWLIAPLLSLVAFFLGRIVFSKLKYAFGDVL